MEKEQIMNELLELIDSATRAGAGLLRRLSAGAFRTDTAITVRQPPSPSVTDDNAPRDTAIVIDVSGSMGACDYPPSRLDGGIQAGMTYAHARAMTHPGDRIAVISFSDEAQVVLPLTPVTKRRTIQTALRKLTIEGGTDLAKGLEAAARLFEDEGSTGRRRHVVMLTDGRGGEPLKQAAKLKNKLGAVIDVVGIGGTPDAVNEALLRQVATTDPGGFCHYRFVKDPETLSEHYTQLAKGLVWNGPAE
jgi:Ca-activated chloride channel family protein